MRAVVIGLLVNVVGSQPGYALLLLNLRRTPAIPWSLPLIAIYLWLCWRYLNGWGWPRSTSAARRELLRARPVAAPVWRWSLLAGGLAATAICAIDFLAERFVPSDPPRLLDLSRVPLPTFVLTYLTLSAAAGIVEEAAYRGYMQSSIERRHGPFVAIALVSLLFTFAHYAAYPTMSPPQFLGLLGIAVLYGTLARLTGSILPGLVIHATGNAVAFLFCWWYAHATGSLRVPLYSETGADSFFWANLAGAMVLLPVSLWAWHRLLLALRQQRSLAATVR